MSVSIAATLDDLAGLDVIHGSELVARLRELESDIEDLEQDADGNDRQGELTQREKDELHELREELDKIEGLIQEIEGYSGDRIGDVALYADHYFPEHAKQYADDVHDLERQTRWPFNHIDWRAAADDLKADYTSIEIGSTEYWYR